jgi:hypothetical protein
MGLGGELTGVAGAATLEVIGVYKQYRGREAPAAAMLWRGADAPITYK